MTNYKIYYQVMDAILQWAVPPVLGLVGGTVASLAAPWAQWGVERRRSRDNERRDLIMVARSVLGDNPPSQHRFRDDVLYSRLRPYLSAQLIEQIEGEAAVIQWEGRGTSTTFYVPEVLDRLVELEREWKLV